MAVVYAPKWRLISVICHYLFLIPQYVARQLQGQILLSALTLVNLYQLVRTGQSVEPALM